MQLGQLCASICLLSAWAAQLPAADVPLQSTDDRRLAATANLGSNEEYAVMLGNVIDFVGEGEFDEAIAILDEKATRPPTGEDREKLKRLFAGIFSGGGAYDGHELVAVETISSRLHKAYALGYHERKPVLYIFTMYQFAGKWKIAHLHWDETLAPLERLAPSHFLAQ
jgi:hypothetical protein